MAICEKCGKEFDESEAADEFDEETMYSSVAVSYYAFDRCLCGECAVQEYENGNYYETCECCGKRFNPEDEESDFQNQVSYKVSDADMFEFGILCADCAAEKLFESIEEEKQMLESMGYHNYYEDDEEDELDEE